MNTSNNIVTIEKLIFGGQALGRVDDKVILLWNALPGETVEFSVTRDKGSYCEGIAEKIITSSPDRINPNETHYLSCSPWQIMSWSCENIWKKKIAQEILKDYKLDFDIKYNNKYYGYRNKMEFSFTADDEDIIYPAFFERGKYSKYVRLDKCDLANDCINKTTKDIISWLNTQQIPIQILKVLMVRCDDNNNTIAALYIREGFKFKDYPKLSNSFRGFNIYLSGFRSNAPVIDGVLYSNGEDFLSMKTGKVSLKYGINSFFQINKEMFELALEDIAKFLEPDKKVIDFFSGVGAVSLPLADKFSEGILVESSEESVNYARINILENKLFHCRAESSSAEDAIGFIKSDSILIFDPPRPGLHKKIISKLLSEIPERIIYLSCNLSTQARDIGYLKEYYNIRFIRLYNFFPRTPHIESLCVLDKKIQV